jgi:hypothetical protein
VSGGFVRPSPGALRRATLSQVWERGRSSNLAPVIPAKAGIQGEWQDPIVLPWAPAFAGETENPVRPHPLSQTWERVAAQ